MPKSIAVSTLNASTLDILNVIRMNASLEYQNLVPEVTQTSDIPKVGDVLLGHPAMANQFINSLLNKVALTLTKSAIFNNPYKELKKGELSYGELVEEIFVEIAKAHEFSAEKGAARNFKRYLPDVKSAFHAINWRVQYPVTVQRFDLEKAFLSEEGVLSLIETIIATLVKGSEYDEYLLFKYQLMKGITNGQFYPIEIPAGSMNEAAITFRSTSNQLTFLSTKYNDLGVRTNTPKTKQYIFMDSQFNAEYDVEVLAAAFNMDKADFTGRLFLIDDWTSFDNERFDVIRANSTQIEEVTSEELALLSNVKAVLVDSDWFQFYDRTFVMSEAEVAAGLYWNYFLTIEKIVSRSPFANAIVYVDPAAVTAQPDSITFTVTQAVNQEIATTIVIEPVETVGLTPNAVLHTQNADATGKLVAVQKYGAYIFPTGAADITPEITVEGTTYTTTGTLGADAQLGDTITFTRP